MSAGLNGTALYPAYSSNASAAPMVRLERIASHFPAPVLGKCDFLNTGGSIKDRIAPDVGPGFFCRRLLLL